MLYCCIFRGFKETAVVLASTGKTVLPAALTTMAGFGSVTTVLNGCQVGFSVLLVNGIGTCFIRHILLILTIKCLVIKGKINKDK